MGVKRTWQEWVPGLLTGLLFIDCSRKFGTGLWFMLLPTALLVTKYLTDIWIWFYCMLIAAVLIGGGTVVDAVLSFVKARFGGSNVPAQPAS